MSPWSILLRMMLIVALVLNGAGAAAASVTMMPATMPGTASNTTPAMLAMSAMPDGMRCHDMGKMTEKPASPEIAVHAADHPGKPTAPDCCKSGICQCACMQAAHAALPAMLAFALASPHSDVAHPMPASHADPALPHLVRPPIG